MYLSSTNGELLRMAEDAISSGYSLYVEGGIETFQFKVMYHILDLPGHGNRPPSIFQRPTVNPLARGTPVMSRTDGARRPGVQRPEAAVHDVLTGAGFAHSSLFCENPVTPILSRLSIIASPSSITVDRLGPPYLHSCLCSLSILGVFVGKEMRKIWHKRVGFVIVKNKTRSREGI